MENAKQKKSVSIRTLTVTAIMGAVATVLMYLSFSVPLMPPFIKLDFSELPALLAAFALGPASGVAVCFLKNLVNVFATTTGGAGELCNFLLGAAFVLPAGLIYKKRKDLKGAVIASLIGTAVMAVLSVPINYCISYPAYVNIMGFPPEAIMDAYRAINSNVENLWQALLLFNAPFTFVKGLFDVALTFLCYKKLSPVLKGAR